MQMNPAPRRVSVWKILAGIITSVTVVIGAAYLWIDAVATRHWDQMVEQVRELHRETLAEGAECPVLRSEPEAGNPWEDYEAAFQSLGPIRIFDYGLALNYLKNG